MGLLEHPATTFPPRGTEIIVRDHTSGKIVSSQEGADVVIPRFIQRNGEQDIGDTARERLGTFAMARVPSPNVSRRILSSVFAWRGLEVSCKTSSRAYWNI